MRPLLQEVATTQTPETLARILSGAPGVVALHSSRFDAAQGRFSFITAWPFLHFRSFGSRCELNEPSGDTKVHYGNPWRVLESLLPRFELLDEIDLPFPLGGCFGFWGYELKSFLEPRLQRHAANDLELPDCQLGLYSSLVAFDHQLGRAWVISTGLAADGTRHERRAREEFERWRSVLEAPRPAELPMARGAARTVQPRGNLTKDAFISRVKRAQAYIRAGDIYQVNLCQRLTTEWSSPPIQLFSGLSALSPAPFAAWLDEGDFQIASSSPELFLKLSGSHVQTRPIKGTRPRDSDSARDAQLAYELQTSPKEVAELIMITDLLRNDLGKVCEYGSVKVPELLRLERYAQVQHLVSTVEGRLRQGISHLEAFAACFPGGSVTGAPKLRAMELIDELEPVARGPYTGALGYLGFNRESQLSIVIRAAICKAGAAHFYTGAGIVADSVPEAEYEETLAKARGFTDMLTLEHATFARSGSRAIQARPA